MTKILTVVCRKFEQFFLSPFEIISKGDKFLSYVCRNKKFFVTFWNYFKRWQIQNNSTYGKKHSPSTTRKTATTETKSTETNGNKNLESVTVKDQAQNDSSE